MNTKDIYQETTSYFLGPIRGLLKDESVSEIMINGPDTVYAERAGKIEFIEGCAFPDEAALMAAAQNIAEFVNRRLDDDSPTIDGRLPDGSRVHVIIPPSARNGITVTIRKFKKSSFDLQQLIKWGSLTPLAAEFLSICVLLHKNIVISGGTGTGKTSMLNALSREIPLTERIVVIEDTSELQLHQPHSVYLEAQPPRPDGGGEMTIRDLFVNSLRMRPDRIVVGEVRRGEALDLIQSMISGHAGSLTTVHANTPRDASIRLETLCLMSDVELPQQVARAQVASAVHLVLQLARLSDHSRRVTAISESLGLNEQGRYEYQDIFGFVATGRDSEGKILGELTPTSIAPTFAGEPQKFGLLDHVKLTREIFQSAESASLGTS